MRDTYSPGLWVLRVGCTVITSPEDLGEQFSRKQEKVGKVGEVHDENQIHQKTQFLDGFDGYGH